MGHEGVQASQSSKSRCAKMCCLCTIPGEKLKCQEGVNLAASQHSKFGPKKILKGGWGVTGEGSLSLFLTLSPKTGGD